MKNEIKQEPIFVDSDKNGVIHTDWRTDKLKNLELTSSYNRLKDKKKAHKCCDCGTYLEFDFDPITGVRKLRKANFCKLRLCPMCIKRRQKKIYGQMSQIMNVLENINNLLHVDEIASYIGVDKIIPRAVVDDENKVKFVKPTKYKVENDNTEIIGLGNELENSEKVLEISEINTQYGVVDFIHRMSNKIIKPIDGRKNGSIDINPKTIDIALNSLKNIGDEEARDYLHYELSKWKNGDFENGVLVHNYVWHMLDGNIGKALSLDTYEVNKIKSKYFK